MRQSDLRFQQQSTVTNALPITPSVRPAQMPGEAGPTTEDVCHGYLAFAHMGEHRPRPRKAQIDPHLICCQQGKSLIESDNGSYERIGIGKRASHHLIAFQLFPCAQVIRQFAEHVASCAT